MNTAQAIIDAAFARSTKNTRAKLATDATELLRSVQQSMRYWWAVGVRLNWAYFADSAIVAQAVVEAAPVGFWQRPDDAEAVAHITLTDGTPVVVRPFDEAAVEGDERPSVYRIGLKYRRKAGDTTPADTASLVMFYGRKAPTLATISATFDEVWPVEYSELLVIDVAMRLATKDGRPEEIAGLEAERSVVADAYRMFLEHEQMNVEQLHWNARMPAPSPMYPITKETGERRR